MSAFVRLVGLELLKLRRGPITGLVLGVCFVIPLALETVLASISPEDALFPRAVLFSGEILYWIPLMTIVVSVRAAGSDYEFGIVQATLCRGMKRYQVILARILATVCAALINSFAYMTGALLATAITHLALGAAPLSEAAGANLIWRIVGAIAVIGLTGFIFGAILSLALVIGRNAWVGMVAGLGFYLADFYLGGLRLTETAIYQYSVSYHALGLLRHFFEAPSQGAVQMSGVFATHSLTKPGIALVTLLLYGCGFILLAMILFHRQDLTTQA